MYLLFDMYLIAGNQLVLEPCGMGKGNLSFAFTTQYMRKNIEDNIAYLLNAVWFYVCILNFLFQLSDCMRKVVYLTVEK